MIEIVVTALLITAVLYLAVNTDSDQKRLKSLAINGQAQAHWRIVVPTSWANRRVGLLNTVLMPEHFGLLMVTSSVHTKGMLCSIDLIGLNKEGKVTHIHASAAPNTGTIKMPKHTQQILELPTGTVQKLAVKLNDSVTFGDLA